MSYPALDDFPPSPSSSAATSSNPQKRLKLTLKPLAPKPTPPARTSPTDHAYDGTHDTPSASVPKIRPIKLKLSSSASPSVSTVVPKSPERPRPKVSLKVKPLKPRVEDVAVAQPMDVDEVSISKAPSTRPSIFSPMDTEGSEPASAVDDKSHPKYEPFFQPPPPPSSSKRAPPPPKPKIPRPIKLKPLKEVLSKLIAQIKKKDDYAFFLVPVDTNQIKNYTDVIKNPMDFGSMSEKVDRGRYRSLDQFKDDFLLTTSNAKAFNPPNTLYHAEASKIETWGLDHINRAATQVIEFETDWSLDAAPTPDAGDGITAEEPPPSTEVSSRARSPSVMSSVAGGPAPSVPQWKSKSKSKNKAPVVTESWEDGGHLPGWKDGLCAFPPRSELAQLMLDLKLRGKRFRSKKERARREKEGPPYLPDGSLDFAELEDSFNAFKLLVPPAVAPPALIRLLAPSQSLPHSAPIPQSVSQPHSNAGTPAPDRESTPTPTPAPENPSLLIDANQYQYAFRGVSYLDPMLISDLVDSPSRHLFANPQLSTEVVGKKKLKHWAITRNPPRPTRANQDDEEQRIIFGEKVQQGEAIHTDYGAFAGLLADIARERGQSVDDFEALFNGDENILKHIRRSIDDTSFPPGSDGMHPRSHTAMDREARRYEDDVRLSETYIRDLVYGGVDGYAYFRSLAEFVGDVPITDPLLIPSDLVTRLELSNVNSVTSGSLDVIGTGKTESDESEDVLDTEDRAADEGESDLAGLPLARWIATRIVEPLTAGNLRTLRDVSAVLSRASQTIAAESSVGEDRTSTAASHALALYHSHMQSSSSSARSSVQALLRAIEEQCGEETQLDIAPLLKARDEMFGCEEDWFGRRAWAPAQERDLNGRRSASPIGARSDSAMKTEATDDETAGSAPDEPIPNGSGLGAIAPSLLFLRAADAATGESAECRGPTSAALSEGDAGSGAMAGAQSSLDGNGGGSGDAEMAMEIELALRRGAEALAELSRRQETSASMEMDTEVEEDEDTLARLVRMNLIALAKRAPIHAIAPLPVHLVPEHIRHIVPTISEVGGTS